LRGRGLRADLGSVLKPPSSSQSLSRSMLSLTRLPCWHSANQCQSDLDKDFHNVLWLGFGLADRHFHFLRQKPADLGGAFSGRIRIIDNL